MSVDHHLLEPLPITFLRPFFFRLHVLARNTSFFDEAADDGPDGGFKNFPWITLGLSQFPILFGASF